MKNEQNNGNNKAMKYATVLAPVFVYAFLHNSSCCESSARTISLHLSEDGAKKALEIHKNNEAEEFLKDYGENEEYPFDYDKWWGTEKMAILP